MEKIKVGSELYLVSNITPHDADTRRFYVGDKVVVSEVLVESKSWIWLGFEGSRNGENNWSYAAFSRTRGGRPLLAHEIEGYSEIAKMNKRVIRD